jgi:cysteine rich repeat protein
MSQSHHLGSVSLALGLWLLAAGALAQTPAPKGPKEMSGPCMADVQKLCADVPGGHGEVMHCLMEHEANLSPACKEKMAAAKGKMEEHASKMKAACSEDASKLCPGMEGGTGLMKCLHQHDAELSKTCHDQMHAGPGMHPPAGEGH